MTMDKSDAFLDGWLAHARDLPSGANPYDEARQARSAAQWTSGWCARFAAVKHGYPLPYDDAAWTE